MDPVLCEVIYTWWCPPGGSILDPFASNATAGLVAAKMGRRYLGVGMPDPGVLADSPGCRWIDGDFRDAQIDETADFLFTEPPGSIAVKDCREIVCRACAMLTANRFAVFVVGDQRDAQGYLRNLPGETVAAAVKAGLRYYNDAILILSPKTLPYSAPRDFERKRMLGLIHRHVLCFVKGDPVAAVKALGKCEFSQNIGEDEEE